MLIVFAALGMACQRSDNTNTPANTQAVNATPAPVINGNAALTANANASPPAELSGYSLASPTEAYHAAYEARKKCDITLLKRVMSETMLATLTARGESDPAKKTLVDMLKLLCELPQAPNGGIKDEKVVGDEATLKYQDEKGVWRLMDFQREKGEWKVTMPRGDRLPALK